MLQNKLYHITHILTENDRFEAAIVMDATHWIFRSHFPSYPIVPGAVWIQIAAELTPGSGTMSELRNAKFLRQFQPTQSEEVQVEGMCSDGMWRVRFFNQDTVYCKLEYRYG